MPFSTEHAERFDTLYQLLNRKFHIKEEAFRLSGTEVRLFSIGDVDELLDELVATDPSELAVRDERLPYWAEIWPASLALAQHILDNQQQVAGKEALEIGCGLGLAGLAGRMAGAEVLITDYQEDALRFSELNWLVNIGESPAEALMDWRQPNLDRQFDVILAADVAYEKRYFWPLLETFHQLLKPGGRILLSEPNRNIARRFFDLLTEEGFGYRRQNVTVEYREKVLTVAVYDIQR